MTSDPTKRFSRAANNYHKYRPSYPDAIIEWLVETARLEGGAPVADIACGTGILTRLLAERGLSVTGVEPNAEMLAIAVANGGAEYCEGTAEETGLPERHFRLTVAAQAFHWFDAEQAVREFARITAPGGKCAAVWNRRAQSRFLEGYESLLTEHSSEYDGSSNWERYNEILRGVPGVTGAEEREFPNEQLLDEEALLGRARSSSYVIHGVSDMAAFEEALRGLYRRHEQDGVVRMKYVTYGICWNP